MSEEALIQKQGNLFLTKIVLVFVIVHQFSFAQIPVKIMPLGDSITSGVNPIDTTAKNGYRKHLYQLLADSGYNIDFVGSLTSGTPQDFDRDNEGHPGMYSFRNSDSSLSMRNNLQKYLSENHPDIILLHIGTNDIGSIIEPKSNDSLAVDVVKLLDIINNFNSNITTVLARIINRTNNKDLQDSTIQFNIKLQSKADSLIALGRKIAVVNMESAVSYPDDISSDEVHPNDKGYRKMADFWFSKIREVFTVNLVYPGNYFILSTEILTLNWKSVLGANHYWLQIAHDENISRLALTDSSITDTSRTTKSPHDNRVYFWRVKGKINNGWGPWSEVWSFTPSLPVSVDLDKSTEEFKLSQNYPDPFNSTTTIQFSIPHETFVSLKIFDLLGNEISNLLNEEKLPGTHSIEFNTSNLSGSRELSSGVYIFSLHAGGFIDNKKMILLK
jgi:lysophospholipase L1-like esterase